MEEHSQPILYVSDGEFAGQEIEIDGESLTIGRTPDRDWCIPSKKISRYHAQIFWQEGHWWIEDKASKNGTFVNQSRISEPVILCGGDKVQLAGALVFEFRDPEATLEETSTQIRSLGIWVETKKGEVFINNKLLNPPLSPQLYRLLVTLWQYRGKVVGNRQVSQSLWPDAPADLGDDIKTRETIDHYFSLLSARLRKADRSHQYIQTVRGKGRMLVQKG
jgi:DNA-binding winged helix-turn-helix (wHTH) protein